MRKGFFKKMAAVVLAVVTTMTMFTGCGGAGSTSASTKSITIQGGNTEGDLDPAGVALGMFIPMELNTPLLIGGAISWYVGSRSKDQALNTARLEKGTLLASGFIAGGALMGVISAALRFGGINLLNEKWLEGNFAEPLAVVMYIALMAYLAISSLSAKKE